MDRPGLQPGKAHPAQHGVHAALTVVGAEMAPGQLADMQQAILDHTVTLDLRTVGDQGCQLREQLFGQQARPTGSGTVAQAFHTSFVEAVNPVPQGLPIHSADVGSLLTADAIEHRRQSQKPARNPTVPLQASLTSQVARRNVSPDRNGHHPVPPQITAVKPNHKLPAPASPGSNLSPAQGSLFKSQNFLNAVLEDVELKVR
jgi:hypothetical protein